MLAARRSVGADAVLDYLGTFPAEVRSAIGRCDFAFTIARLDGSTLLHQVVTRFSEIDLRHETVSDDELGRVLDDLMQQFVERSADVTGEHFTPSDVARLMASLVLGPDAMHLAASRSPVTVLDPCCGTGNILREVDEQAKALNPAADLRLFGQEINGETWARCCLRMMIGGRDSDGFERGDSLTADGHADRKFDYLVSAPPMGASWGRHFGVLCHEHEVLGMRGRFGAGLPSSSDSSLLFLQHLLSKMKLTGSRVVTLLGESAMVRGDAGSGESAIRQWVIENDWLDCVVALPRGLLVHTAVPTYLWVLSNRKSSERRGKVALVDARGQAERMRRPLGVKRDYLTNDQIRLITEACRDAAQNQANPAHPMHELVRVLDNADCPVATIR